MRKRGWRMVAHEWYVVPHKEEHGKGDLVFLNEREPVYCVMECKRRTSPVVEEQARFYGAAWKLKHAQPDHAVIYGIWTCRRKRILGLIETMEEARKLCERPACNLL